LKFVSVFSFPTPSLGRTCMGVRS